MNINSRKVSDGLWSSVWHTMQLKLWDIVDYSAGHIVEDNLFDVVEHAESNLRVPNREFIEEYKF